RIAKFQIISFPNFAFYKNRIELLLKGRMPKKMLFGYSWYNTGHIHQLSIKDFEEFIENVGGFEIVERSFIKSNTIKDKIVVLLPNLFMQFPIYLLRKTNETY
ncbi:methionine biosynthesis protein MetW, partial [Ignavibacterium sp.]|uniref:methionine biosynthesis protein MetW n=1 Tax=Ignavibacterium sp. TaxID=2651167 RepID=UPI00307E7973